MVRDALKTSWLIGMIQPRTLREHEEPMLYPVGCAGKIVSFAETKDSRLLITLCGVQRFETIDELPEENGYRRFRVNWKPFEHDNNPVPELAVDRRQLEIVLRQYLEVKKIPVKWEEVKNMRTSLLVTSLAMQCPFTEEEKQALLEAPDLKELTNLMVSLLTMAGTSNAASSDSSH